LWEKGAFWCGVGITIGLAIGALIAYSERYLPTWARPERLETYNVLLGAAIGLGTSLGFTYLSMKQGKEDLSSTADKLVSASGEIQEAVKRFQTETQGRLEELTGLSGKLGLQILNIEDATRKLLEDFPEIFSAAFEMVTKARARLWILNFTPCFGHIHAYNKRFIESYAQRELFRSKSLDDQREFLLEHVRRFTGDIESKSEWLQDFKLATVNCEDLMNMFVRPVLTKINDANAWYAGSEQFEGTINQHIEDSVRNRHETAISGINTRCENRCGRLDFLNKVPLQMFIADRDGKDTCLVFFIGTDNINSEHEIKGFYTEFPDIVKLFKGVFAGIVRDHAKRPPFPTGTIAAD
jgi:hypothetical protein